MGALDIIKSLNLIQVSNIEDLNEHRFLQYLDYVDVVKDIKIGGTYKDYPKSVYVDDLLEDGFIDPETSKKLKTEESEEMEIPMVSLSLVLRKVLLEFKDEHVDLSAGEDPQNVVVDFLLKKSIAKIKELAAISKIEFDNSIKDKESTLDSKIEGDNLSAKIISKILRATNIIARRTRRGPGTFVIAKREYLDEISKYKPQRFLYPLEFNTNISNLKMLVCDELGDEIIVGRSGSSEEAGIRLTSNDESLEKNLTFNETDISGVNIRYALDSYGPQSHLNYISFKIEK